MRLLTIFSIVFFISACGSEETASFQSSAISVSGEFLFEGPNTLQGPATIKIDDIASKIGVVAEEIKAIYVTEATISFSPDSSRTMIESALVQWVSDDLPLVSVATKSPLTDEKSVSLEVNNEEDILNYIKDASSTLVVDVNLSKDADNLEANVLLLLNIVY